ncbi:HAD family hydrolase [Ulvibacterium sp.]|uniref:HAD family hydrolase n=1 Tax=Ulvibacterium sp. TaxID=2665914 RepID=UPI003BA9B38C
MDRKIIVYDFDKTLTYKDTLFGFFLHSSSKNFLFPFKVLFYYALMIGAWLKLITNTNLKEYGIRLFLKEKRVSYLRKVSTSYVERIRFNKLFSELNFNDDNIFYIASASFEVYLKIIFPEHVNILASQIKYVNNRVKGLKFNCYGENKINALAKYGVKKIDVLFTDSYNDYPLASISKKIIIVKEDQLIEFNNIESFKTYFGR